METGRGADQHLGLHRQEPRSRQTHRRLPGLSHHLTGPLRARLAAIPGHGSGIPRSTTHLLACLVAGTLALTAAVASVAPRTSGTPFLRQWTAEDYGGAAGNRCVLQHPDTGYIYVGNNTGVLEFDGVRWRLIRVPGRPTVRTLAVDAQGMIWTASDDTICRLVPNPRGELVAEPMRERIPPAARTFRSASASLAGPGGVFVATAQHLLFFPPGDAPARTWAMAEESPTVRMWWVQGAPHWQLANRRVYRLRAEQIEAADSPAAWLSDLSSPLAPTLTTVLAGLSPQGEEGSTAALTLADGRIAVGTAREGLLVYDRAGRIVQRLDRTSGLPSNRIEHLSEDREGGVWLALRNGLVRAQLDSPYALHGPAQGFDGSLISLGLDRGDLYLAAGEGLLRRDPAGRFRFFDQLTGAPRKLVYAGDRLYAAGSNLQRALPDGRFKVIDERQHVGFTPLRTTPGAFVFGAPNGLWLGRAEGEAWRRLGRLPAINGATFVLLEEPAGIVWAVSSSSGLWRIDFRAGARLDAPARNFQPTDGLPAGLNEVNTRVFPLGREVELIARGSLLRYDAGRDRFEPETRIAGLPRAAPAVSTGAGPATGASAAGESTVISVACAGRDGTAWLQLPAPLRQTFHVVPDGPDRWRAEPLAGPPLPRFAPVDLLFDPGARTLWSGGPGGLISQDLGWQPSRPTLPLVARLRRVESEDGVTLWADGLGSAFAPRTASPADRLEPTAPLRLQHAQNALRLVFAAPTYTADHRGRTHTLFRTRLDGLDRGWTNWTRTAQREFTNLPYRDFTFRVQARDDDGRISEEGKFAFAIAPPWWLTGWAFGAYTLLGLAAGREFIRYRTRALLRQAAALEAVVAARTEELRIQNLELARLHRLELDEKISAKLAAQQAQLAREKSDLELLRYQLNPHFLFNTLTSVSGLVLSKPASARHMVAKLAEFCRGTLTRRSEETRTLAEEFAMLSNYLEIEQVRWEDGLQVEINLDRAVGEARLPAFLLLPLVENAIKYGGQTSPDVLKIRLVAQAADDGAVTIEVANTGRWLDPSATRDSTHIGLDNLRERLARAFPARHDLTTESRDGWVFVRLCLRPV